jgi:hypothetical protein
MPSSQCDAVPMSVADLEEFGRNLRRFVERELMPFERHVVAVIRTEEQFLRMESRTPWSSSSDPR